MNHVWSMNSALHIQVQASDVWDTELVEEHVKRMKEIMLTILDQC